MPPRFWRGVEVEHAMIRITVEVSNRLGSFSVVVRSESIDRALEVVRGRYPLGDARVVFPLDPETFFVRDPFAGAELVEPGELEEVAG